MSESTFVKMLHCWKCRGSYIYSHSYYIVDAEEFPNRKPNTVSPKTFLKMNAEMEKYVYGPLESPRYLREVGTSLSYHTFTQTYFNIIISLTI